VEGEDGRQKRHGAVKYLIRARLAGLKRVQFCLVPYLSAARESPSAGRWPTHFFPAAGAGSFQCRGSQGASAARSAPRLVPAQIGPPSIGSLRFDK
jgi:hypothetical protein